MHISSFEYIHAMLTLHQAGIKDADAITCLNTINRVEPGTVTYRDFLASLDGKTVDELAERYGHDAVRAACALRARERA